MSAASWCICSSVIVTPSSWRRHVIFWRGSFCPTSPRSLRADTSECWSRPGTSRGTGSFYRAMLMGSCAFGLARTLHGLVSPFGQQLVVRMSDGRSPRISSRTSPGSLSVGGPPFSLRGWLMCPIILDPEAFADRLIRMLSAVALREPSPELMITAGGAD